MSEFQADPKSIYQAPTEETGQQALEAFAAARDSRYPQISRSWQANWPNLATLFAYPTDIRKVIYRGRFGKRKLLYVRSIF
ncbi:transposase [Escherichia marmotae]|uniref:transposase n=1 Tax=Escherichia TaxID=561 RepID=UPI003A8D6B05